MLTAKMQELLLFIHKRLGSDGVSPSFEEMKDALGLKSKSGIHRLIEALEERGYIERLPNRARALEVKKLPENMAQNFGGALKHAGDKIAEFITLPLLGKIAAGHAIEAIEQANQFVEIPSSMLGRSAGEHFALTVEGDSMIKAGIYDGDTVIIRQCNTANDGKIIVALIDDSEVTLKRLYRQQGKIVLQAENDAYKPRILNPDRVRIQGELVSLLRSFH